MKYIRPSYLVLAVLAATLAADPANACCGGSMAPMPSGGGVGGSVPKPPTPPSVAPPTINVTPSINAATNAGSNAATNATTSTRGGWWGQGPYKDSVPAKATQAARDWAKEKATDTAGDALTGGAYSKIKKGVKGAVKAVDSGEKYYDQRNTLSNQNQQQMQQQLQENQQPEGSGLTGPSPSFLNSLDN
jgi:hypothetical protein